MGASFETANRGVSALAASLIKIINVAFPVAKIQFLVGGITTKSTIVSVNGRDVPVIFYNYRLSPKAKLNEHILWILLLAILYRFFPSTIVRRTILKRNTAINILATSDLIGDIRGGDSFSDIYGVRRFILEFIPCLVALLVGKDFILLPQTYGPYKSSISRWIARYTFKKTKIIMSRDMDSIKLIKNLCCSEISNKRLIFCPDVAFMLDPVFPKPATVSFISSISGKDDVLVGININGLMYNGGYNRDNMFGLKCDYRELMKILVNKLLEDNNIRIIFIPHTYGSYESINNDLVACNDIMSSLQEKGLGRIQVLKDEFNQNELKWIIGRCDIFIGSRMHSCIAAISQGIPTIGIAYSSKFKGVFESVTLGDMVVDARFMDMETLLARILQMFEDYKKNSRLLNNEIMVKIENGKRSVNEIFKKIAVSVVS